MNEDFVSEETAKLAKKTKFNLISKDNSVCAPTQAEIAKWLRYKYNIHVTPILSTCDKDGKGVYKCNIAFPDNNGTCLSIDSLNFYAYKETKKDKFCINIGKYEEAMELGLKFALNTLINKNHYKDIEHKIGEVFKYDGKNIKVKKCDGRYECEDCIHEKTDGGCCMHDEFEKFKDFEECVAEYRKDKENVKFTEFKENEKI